MATWVDVSRVVTTLPETTEPTPRTWRVRKKLIVWERPLRNSDLEALGADAPDGDILGVRVADEHAVLQLHGGIGLAIAHVAVFERQALLEHYHLAA